MSSGLNAGLVAAGSIRDEFDKNRQARMEAIMKESDDVTGRVAETVYRDKTGGKISRDEYMETRMRKRKKRQAEPEQQIEWGGGVVQKDAEAKKLEEIQSIVAEPFQRFDIAASYDKELREKVRTDDPAMQFATIEKADQKAARPKCRFPAPTNRFGIPPGYRWDGKVRSNGYERRWFEAKDGRKRQATENYRSSMADM